MKANDDLGSAVHLVFPIGMLKKIDRRELSSTEFQWIKRSGKSD